MVFTRPVNAVVFDMDGLLIDSQSVACEALTAQAATMGYDLPPEILKGMIGQTWAVNDQLLLGHFGAAFDTHAMQVGAIERFYELAAAGIALKAGALELLDHLDEVAMSRAIATSSRPQDVEHHLGRHGLVGRFHSIIGQGDYAQGKPAPDPYLAAANALGVAPGNCLALEDSHSGVRSAAAAGMMTIMVPDLLDPTEEMRSLCVAVAADLFEVREMLRGQLA
jgi:HAD superfamily hydrolase (TIGR01509 family)